MSPSADLSGATSRWLRTASAEQPRALFARVGGATDEAPDAMRAGEIDALADHYAGRLAETGIAPGSRLLLLGSPEPRTIAAIAGAARAGLDVGLVSPGLGALEIARAARAFAAAALAGPTRFAQSPTRTRLFEAAASLDGIAFVALHGEGAPGAVGLDGAREDDAPPARASREPRLFASRLDPEDGEPVPIGADLAREFVARAPLSSGQAIVSTLSLASPAGLLAGIFAPLLAGAHVVWQAPFASRRFVAVLEASAPAHLFAPAEAAAELGAAGLLTPDRVASLTLTAAAGTRIPPVEHRLDPARVFVLWSEGTLRLEAAGNRSET